MENSSQIYTEFLPISRADMEARGWEQLDFVVVGGDAYVDHPSFGTAIISRLLEAEGYKVGVLAQPRYTDCEDFKRFGKPKYGFFIGGGNVDSMVSHYSVAKIPRAEDEYSPGGKGGARPDRSATVYTRLAKQAYPDLPVILGGLEASLRRFAHYDYWLDTVLPSIAEDSGADIISFGMGEHQTVAIARRLAAGEPVSSITDVDGTCYLTDFDHLPEKYVECAGFKKVASDKTAYAKACRIQMDNQDVVSGQIIVQKQSEKYLVQNIPAKPLVRWQMGSPKPRPRGGMGSCPPSMKRSNRCASASLFMPQPLSATVILTFRPSVFTRTRTLPPCGVNLSALERRLSSILRIAAVSRPMIRLSRSDKKSSVTPCILNRKSTSPHTLRQTPTISSS